jgi:5-methylthioadenosine/S-adenosylhomocysteine deaminase
MMTHSLLIKNGTLVTVDAEDRVFIGDLFIEGGRIVSVGGEGQRADSTIDATGCAVIPGFVQTHLHLCQTLFRGAADDLSLIDWLRMRVWPMEAAHTPESVRAAARLGLAELIKGGTTCALTMETVSHTEEVFKAVEESGFRATVGKCMMDKGDDVPAGLHEKSSDSISESLALLTKWHGAAEGKIRYCFAPRFAVSCTEQLLSEVGRLAREHNVMVHTHASENQTECEIVERDSGLRNISYLHKVGLTGPHVALAHCVHVDDSDLVLLQSTQTNVAHCPSSNLKLGSGIAPVHEMIERGISVSLGADGAACNNRLDMFTEMRTAALLQKVKHGPDVLPARRSFRMATADGARALGLGDTIGSLEVGKQADIAVVRLGKLHLTPGVDVVSTLVYSGQASDVEYLLIDGQLLLREGNLVRIDEASVLDEATREFDALTKRAGFGKR